MEFLSSAFTIDIRRLRVLRELQQRGTIGATARALHLTPSAISQQLSTLSREIGVPLLAPQGRGGASYAAANTAIPGAVLIGGTDGKVHALASADGKELWSFDTAREFETVNQVAAKGGSIGSAGPTIAAGMVFIGSGYSVTSGMPGNVLLAFAP